MKNYNYEIENNKLENWLAVHNILESWNKLIEKNRLKEERKKKINNINAKFK